MGQFILFLQIRREGREAVFVILSSLSKGKVPKVLTILKKYFVFAWKTLKSVEKVQVTCGLVLRFKFLLKTLERREDLI